MSYTIDHFMWAYQEHFRIRVQTHAESVLNRLDPDLSPDIFLVGILEADREDRFTRWWAIAPKQYPRGVFKFRSIEEAQEARLKHTPLRKEEP